MREALIVVAYLVALVLVASAPIRGPAEAWLVAPILVLVVILAWTWRLLR